MTERIKHQSKSSEISGTRLTVYTGVFVCFGVLLPFVTSHAFGLKGNIFLPMHIPVMLCGFICGAKRGCLCGLIAPAVSCLFTEMPAAYPMLPIMVAELAVYGLMSGFLYNNGFKTTSSLIVAMLAGRISYGVVFYILLLGNTSLTLAANPIFSSMPVVSALIIGVPGIILQLVFVPSLVSFLVRRLRLN